MYLKEHRGRRTPSPWIWTRVFNWVHDLGVAVADGDQRLGVTLEDLESDVTLAVEDLRPRIKHVQITLAAVDDIRFCEKLFDKWMAELDKCVMNLFSQHHVPSTNDNNGFTEP